MEEQGSHREHAGGYPTGRWVRHLVWIAVVWVAVAVPAASAPADGVLRSLRALKMGANEASLVAARRGLVSQPADLDLLALEATGLGRTGRYLQALDAFEFVPGGGIYEQYGLGVHADALRAAGHTRRAAELREERWIAAADDRVELGALLHNIDDWIEVGDLDRAMELSLRAMGMAPDSADVHALHAEVLLALGERDEALYHLMLASVGSTRGLFIRAQLAVWEGDFLSADKDLAIVRRQRPRWAKGAALRARVMVAMGTPRDGVAIVDMPVFAHSEDPDLLKARANAYAAMGHKDDATRLLARVFTMYPELLAAAPRRRLTTE